MKKSISIFLLLSLLIQSCVVYQKTSVPINEAWDKGPVKIIDEYGADEFDFIERTDYKYYGVIKNGRTVDKTPIDTVGVSAIYSKDIRKSKNRSIALAISLGLGIPALIIGVMFISFASN